MSRAVMLERDFWKHQRVPIWFLYHTPNAINGVFLVRTAAAPDEIESRISFGRSEETKATLGLPPSEIAGSFLLLLQDGISFPQRIPRAMLEIFGSLGFVWLFLSRRLYVCMRITSALFRLFLSFWPVPSVARWNKVYDLANPPGRMAHLERWRLLSKLPCRRAFSFGFGGTLKNIYIFSASSSPFTKIFLSIKLHLMYTKLSLSFGHNVWSPTLFAVPPTVLVYREQGIISLTMDDVSGRCRSHRKIAKKRE